MTTTGITEAQVDDQLLGICPHCAVVTPDHDPSAHASDCPVALRLDKARGDVLIPGEVCSGPCHLPLAAGETTTTVRGEVWCIACAATARAARPPQR